MAEAHGPIHALLDESGKICREVKDIDGGIYSRTVSDDPEVTEQIRLHVAQMKQRMETGAGLRHWDPLFVELFRNHEKITMQIRDIEGGVEVWETSDDPEVTELIRQHARRAVSEFVAEGYDRAHEPTPLPGTDAP
jgi:hypothetical protein